MFILQALSLSRLTDIACATMVENALVGNQSVRPNAILDYTDWVHLIFKTFFQRSTSSFNHHAILVVKAMEDISEKTPIVLDLSVVRLCDS